MKRKMFLVMALWMAGFVMNTGWSGGAQALAAWVPDKPVELITSSAAGGSNDQIARVMQRIIQDGKLSPTPISVINKHGGNQTIAPTYLNMQAGNPHYLLLANPTLVGNHILGRLKIHSTDLSPIALLLTENSVFSVRKDSPFKSMKEVFDKLRADPKALTIGTVALSGPNHLALCQAAKVSGVDPKKLKTVIFKTNAESMTAMVGGHIDLVSSSISSARAQIEAGNARVLAVASEKRMGGKFSSIPTLRDQGIDASVASWRGVFGPKGLSREQVAYWEEVLERMVATADWQKNLESHSWSDQFLRGEAFAKYLEKDYAITGALMQELGLVKTP